MRMAPMLGGGAAGPWRRSGAPGASAPTHHCGTPPNLVGPTGHGRTRPATGDGCPTVVPMSEDAADRWRKDLRERDEAVHAQENADALAHEVAGLRRRNAELAAALTQARAGIDVRDAMMRDLSAHAAEHDAALAAATARAEQAERSLAEVLGSLRWRAGGAVSTAVRLPVTTIRRLGGK